MEQTLSNISLRNGENAQQYVFSLNPKFRRIATEAILECLKLGYPLNDMEITSKARELQRNKQKNPKRLAIKRFFHYFCKNINWNGMTELVIQIDNNALLPSLKKVITSLKGVKNAILTRHQPAVSPTAVRLLSDLATFQSYKKGWDGEDASPLSQKTAKHFLQLLGKSSDEDLKDWNIFPEKNGTLILENENKNAQINLADKEFSYFKDCNGTLQGANHLKYTAKALSQIIQKINQ